MDVFRTGVEKARAMQIALMIIILTNSIKVDSPRGRIRLRYPRKA